MPKPTRSRGPRTAPAPIEEGVLSGDGEWLIARVGREYSVAGDAGGRDVIAIRPGRDTVPTPLMVTGFDEKAIVLSPDGRWLAYESDETGRNEISVRSFPGIGAGWPVSVNGGVMPLWRPSPLPDGPVARICSRSTAGHRAARPNAPQPARRRPTSKRRT